jgi:hypothetical protein
MPLSLPEYVTRWKASTLTERAAAQSHFIDLCEVLGQPHPAAADQTGDSYTFEKYVSRLKGGKGYHDDRTHLALAKGTPAGRGAETNPDADCRVISMPRLGGLHHRYDLAA